MRFHVRRDVRVDHPLFLLVVAVEQAQESASTDRLVELAQVLAQPDVSEFQSLDPGFIAAPAR